MSPEIPTRTLLTLPGEVQNTIVGHLEPLDCLLLRITCRHFRTIIPPFDMHNLLLAESSKTGYERDLYACRLCLRLRHSSHFADKMKKSDKRKITERGYGINRFCVDCGLSPPPGQTGYGRGTFITRNGVVSVRCIICMRLTSPAQDKGGSKTQYCARCWSRTPEGEEMQREQQAELQRQQEVHERRRQERKQWRARYGAASDTDYDTSDEESDEFTLQPKFGLPWYDDGDDWRDIGI